MKLSAARVADRFLKAAKRITVKDLEEIGGNMLQGDEDLEALAKLLNGAHGERAVDNAMSEASDVLGLFGVEAIWEEGNYSNPVATYVNTGDSYAMTLVYDVEEDEILLTGWGDFVEDFEREHSEDGRAIR